MNKKQKNKYSNKAFCDACKEAEKYGHGALKLVIEYFLNGENIHLGGVVLNNARVYKLNYKKI